MISSHEDSAVTPPELAEEQRWEEEDEELRTLLLQFSLRYVPELGWSKKALVAGTLLQPKFGNVGHWVQENRVHWPCWPQLGLKSNVILSAVVRYEHGEGSQILGTDVYSGDSY